MSLGSGGGYLYSWVKNEVRRIRRKLYQPTNQPMAASMKMNQLIKKRDEIEAEIKALNEVLESVCSCQILTSKLVQEFDRFLV